MRICSYLGKDTNQIIATTSTECGINLLYNDKVTRLEMKRTMEIIQANPLEIDKVITEICESFKQTKE